MVGSLAVLFVAAELASALVLPAPIVWRYPQESYVYDAELGHRLRPNQHAFTHAAAVSTNSYGLRNEEISAKPSPGTIRILCLGDSLTFGNGVEATQTYPRQVEALLNGAGPARYEVINAGVPAYDTWQEVAYLRRRGLEFAPDLVVIGFYANDIVPRPKNLAAVQAATRGDEGREVKRVRGDWAIYWLKRSRLLLLLRQRFNQLLNRVEPSPDVTRKLSLLSGESNDLVEDGWREIDASFGEVQTLAKQHGFHVLVVFFPIEDQVFARYPQASYPGRAKELAARHGLPALDLLPAFTREASGFGSLFIEWDGHPNRRAYGIAAREIKSYLSTRADWRRDAGAPAR